MPVRAGVRLLDMGVVRPLRSQSIYHGITASITTESDPVIILSRANNPYFAVNPDSGLPYNLDNGVLDKHNIKMVGKYLGGSSYLIEKHHLCVQIVLPHHTIVSMNLPADYKDRRAFLIAPFLAALSNEKGSTSFNAPNELIYHNKKLGIIELEEFDQASTISVQVSMDSDIAMMTQIPANVGRDMQNKLSIAYAKHTTSIKSENDYVPTDESIGASIIQCIEDSWGIAAYPSFPTLEELDEIAEYDDLLSMPGKHGAKTDQDSIIIPIKSGVAVAQITTSVSAKNIDAVIYVVNGELEGLIVTGEIDSMTNEAMDEIADRVASTGISHQLMVDKLLELQGLGDGSSAELSNNLLISN